MEIKREHDQQACENAYRSMLANKKPPITTDKQIIAWLKGQKSAISAWEARWLARLEGKA